MFEKKLNKLILNEFLCKKIIYTFVEFIEQNDLAIQLGCAHDRIHVKLRFYSLVYPKTHAKKD